MFDGKAFGEEIVGFVREYVDEQVSALKAELEAANAKIAELEARPIAEKGEKGDPGEPGEKGADGAAGTDGKDGVSVAGSVIDRAGNLILTLSNGETRDLGPVIGKDGEPGKDGRDGFGFEDLDACVLDDDRTIELCFRRGDEEKAFTFKWPTMIYRQVFKQGEEYEPGDVVTWGGSLWHCNEKTTDKPDAGPWTLAAKKGRDGKDAKVG